MEQIVTAPDVFPAETPIDVSPSVLGRSLSLLDMFSLKENHGHDLLKSFLALTRTLCPS